MNFKDYEKDINISYKNIGEDAFCSIINPLLSCAKVYRRSVGFFSSSALNFINQGILDLVKNGGRIELATSPKLSEEDIEAIEKGYKARDILENRLLNEIDDALDFVSSECAELLYQLIKEGAMDIKIVTKNGGMYHDKLAVIKDLDDNTIAFVGSNNESSSGYNYNYEKIRVYRSWVEKDRVDDEVEEFESIWNNNNQFLDVYEFKEAYKNRVVECVEHKIIKKKKEEQNKIKIRPYQQEAIDGWRNNGYKGFFEMATGTGKTFTAICSFNELIRKEKVFTIILAPYKHLIEQWRNAIKSLYSDLEPIVVTGEKKLPEQLIYADYIQAKIQYKPIIVISTIKSFFLSKYQDLYKKIEFDKLLVVDEAHNFSNHLTEDLSEQFKYKLGLSATPIFGKNEQKTTDMLDWFGGKVISFPIEKAIGKYLVNYEYHPIYVETTEEDERKFNAATKKMLSLIDANGKILNEEEYNKAYRARLRAISMAEEKSKQIQRIYNEIQEKDHTIIYCSDGKLFRENYDDNNLEEIKHLNFILEQINYSIISKDKNLKATKFTAYETAEERMKIIKLFDEAKVNYLVAIKCLDEGIDIPSIKSALLLSSNDNYREFVQRRGRILRLDDSKEIAKIYDVIVLPSKSNVALAKIELRRFNEYARIALNGKDLSPKFNEILRSYGLTEEDIKFENEYIYYGGDLDEQ